MPPIRGSQKYHLEIMGRLPTVPRVHHVDTNGVVWATSNRTILVLRNNGYEKIATFPYCWPRDLFGWFRPLARAFRSENCNIFVNRAGNILGIRGRSVYAVSPPHCHPLFQIQGDCVLHGAVAEDPYGCFYFGEYFRNPQRRAVRIWKITPSLEAWEVAHEFPPGSICHVHAIHSDPYNQDTFWITVGDYVGECYLLRTNNQFRSLEWFGDGTQIWRAVNLFFTENHVCWLTDSEISQNYACRIHRSTGQLEKGQEIDCSTWYGATTSEGLHIAFTTVEKGPAIKTNRSSILVSRNAFNWQEIFSFRKDFYRPIRLFKFGSICCPSGSISSDNLFISGEALEGLDGISLHIKIKESF